MAHHARLFPILYLVFHPRQRSGVRRRNRPLESRKPLLGLFSVIAQRVILHNPAIRHGRLVFKTIAHFGVGIAKLPQRFIGTAIQRILVRHEGQAVGGCWKTALGVIKRSGAEFFVAQHFLRIAKHLLRLGKKLAVGELHGKLAALIFGALRLSIVPVGLFHLLVVDLADAPLRLGGFFHGWVKQDEVLVLGFRLRQTVGAALAIPAIGNGQLGLGEKFAGVVGIDQRIQG